MESNKCIINEIFGNDIFKIFLLILPFIIFRSNYKFAFLISLFLLLINNYESFTNTTIDLNKMFEILDVKKLNYTRQIMPNQIEIISHKITKKALKENKLRQIIDQKIIEIYGEITNNNNLMEYLRFNNLVNKDGLPIFINESDEVLLKNQIKIILFLIPNNELDKIKDIYL